MLKIDNIYAELSLFEINDNVMYYTNAKTRKEYYNRADSFHEIYTVAVTLGDAIGCHWPMKLLEVEIRVHSCHLAVEHIIDSTYPTDWNDIEEFVLCKLSGRLYHV